MGKRHILQQGHAKLAEGFLHLILATIVRQRVGEGDTLLGQRVRREAARFLAIFAADGKADRTARQAEEAAEIAIQRSAYDMLLDAGPVDRVRRDERHRGRRRRTIAEQVHGDALAGLEGRRGKRAVVGNRTRIIIGLERKGRRIEIDPAGRLPIWPRHRVDGRIEAVVQLVGDVVVFDVGAAPGIGQFIIEVTAQGTAQANDRPYRISPDALAPLAEVEIVAVHENFARFQRRGIRIVALARSGGRLICRQRAGGQIGLSGCISK